MGVITELLGCCSIAKGHYQLMRFEKLHNVIDVATSDLDDSGLESTSANGLGASYVALMESPSL